MQDELARRTELTVRRGEVKARQLAMRLFSIYFSKVHVYTFFTHSSLIHSLTRPIVTTPPGSFAIASMWNLCIANILAGGLTATLPFS